MVVADLNADQDTVVHRRVPKPDAVPLDCQELGTPVSPQHAAVLLDRRGLGSPAQHARLTKVPRDTEGRGSPPRLQGEQERPSRRHRTGAALQENWEHRSPTKLPH
ncbi:hypothetical protein D4764_06G0004850 [Takifugu flavidus]|uniref:Uncharacterized protein n=1 Tax=Takifugu flavidus TaxID=433684 RepID=A0A5C6MVT2_9TELE|nr:hypothetical protein D4764_06G0004850 [Takifugu flavidus]